MACTAEPPAEAAPSQGDSLAAAAAEDEQHETIAEDFGEHAIGVRLSTPTDGARVDAISAELFNTTDVVRTAWLELSATTVGSRAARRSYGPYELAGGASMTVHVPVHELPIQASHVPVRVAFSSREQRSDGIDVRGTGAMARLQFDLDREMVALHPVDSKFQASWPEFEHVPTTAIGHIYDEAKGELVELTTDILTLSPGARIIGVGTSFKQLPKETEQVPEQLDELDGEGGALVPKASSTTFCPYIDYQFNDSGLGENVFADGVGITPAMYHYVDINRNGADFWSGWLSSNACSPTRTTSAGTYRVELYSAVKRSPVEIWIGHSAPLDGVTTQILDVAVSSTTPNRMTPLFNIGPLDLNNGMAVAKQGLLYAHVPMATGSNVILKLVLDQGCTHSSGCFERSTTSPVIKLGRNEANVQHAFTKFVVGHELGHFASFRHFGSLSNNLSLNSSAPVCSCGHVRPEIDQSHCLQSQEGISVAQQEGFAHYAATLMMNNLKDGYHPCRFNYYKQFAWFGDPSHTSPLFVQEPAVAFACDGVSWWLLENCPAADRGTELDWLTFYWWLLHPGNVTWAELRTMYITACGNARCNSTVVRWPTLLNSAPSTKRQLVQDIGFEVAVDF